MPPSLFSTRRHKIHRGTRSKRYVGGATPVAGEAPRAPPPIPGKAAKGAQKFPRKPRVVRARPAAPAPAPAAADAQTPPGGPPQPDPTAPPPPPSTPALAPPPIKIPKGNNNSLSESAVNAVKEYNKGFNDAIAAENKGDKDALKAAVSAMKAAFARLSHIDKVILGLDLTKDYMNPLPEGWKHRFSKTTGKILYYKTGETEQAQFRRPSNTAKGGRRRTYRK
jgi:hypothetical protein